MMPEKTRRDILRSASGSIALGFASGTVVARDDRTESKSDPVTSSDFRVRNQSPDPVTASVRFYETTGADQQTADVALLSTEFRGLGRDGGSPVAEERLGIPGGQYVVEVSLDDGTTERETWAVPPGGVADWSTFSVRIRPTGDITMGPTEI